MWINPRRNTHGIVANETGGAGLRLDNLDDLLKVELKDLYGAEQQLIKALPQMSAAAHSPDLKSAFDQHLGETRRQKDRLEQAFRILGCEPETESCEAMEGLIEEGNEIIAAEGDPEVKDAALISAAQAQLSTTRLRVMDALAHSLCASATTKFRFAAKNARRGRERRQDPHAYRRELCESRSGASVSGKMLNS